MSWMLPPAATAPAAAAAELSSSSAGLWSFRVAGCANPSADVAAVSPAAPTPSLLLPRGAPDRATASRLAAVMLFWPSVISALVALARDCTVTCDARKQARQHAAVMDQAQQQCTNDSVDKPTGPPSCITIIIITRASSGFVVHPACLTEKWKAL
jgi:hypothetical protein